jgi:DNA polymerase IV
MGMEEARTALGRLTRVSHRMRTVLPPESRSFGGPFVICRLLLIKAARRSRWSGFYCSGLWLWLSVRDGLWSGKRSLPMVRDDKAVLSAR